jgi:DMSO/TMAO reductase YedYZ molybdopterin-dependent catalytic subunit
MEDRRKFLKKSLALFPGVTFLSGFLPVFMKDLFAKGVNNALTKSADSENLIRVTSASRHERTGRRPVTPLKSFGVMGETEYKVNIKEWRLEIKRDGEEILRLTYEEILSLPSIERWVELECPGYFTNYGIWKGFSLGRLLEDKGIEKMIKKARIIGQNGRMRENFYVRNILSDKVFLAYGVNGEILPIRNGFPLRIVAEGYTGGCWVKYVEKIVLE